MILRWNRPRASRSIGGPFGLVLLTAANVGGATATVASTASAAGAPLHAIDILDKPTCAGGIVLARATDCLSRRATFTITGEDSFTVELPLTSTAAPYLTSRYVVRAQFADDPDNFNEWRLLDDDAVVVNDGGRVTATAYDLVNDLAAVGPIRTTDAATGVSTFTFSVEATPAELIDTYILPRLAAKGYTWISRGTVEPTDTRLWEWSTFNPLELLRLIVAETASEYRLRRIGTSGYAIDVVAAINGNLPTIEVRPGVNLREFRRSRKGANHYTVLEGFGLADGSGVPATIARAAWKVTNVDTANNRLTLADPLGVGSGPVVENNQYVHTDTAPGYLFRYEQGGLHRVLASSATNQTVDLDSVVGYAVGDLVELRGGAGASTYASEITDGWSAGLWAGKRVTAIDTGNKRLTLDDPFADISVVPADSRYRGWTVRPYSLAASSAMSANTASGNNRQCTVASTTGMQAGDLVYHTASNPSGAPNWSPSTNAGYEVVSVDSGTLVTIKHRRKSGAIGSLSNTFLSAWRARSDRACSACSASGSTVDVDSVTSIVVGDIVECVRRFDGPVQTELASPIAVALHGSRSGIFERPVRGERNLLAARNAYFADWTAGANAAPDGWLVGTGSRLFGLKNTTADYLNTGINSVRLAPKGIAQINTGCSAGGTSVVLSTGSGSGHRFQVGESVILSQGTGNAETVVLTSVSGDGLTLGFAPCANVHNATEVVHGVTGTASGGLISQTLDVPTNGAVQNYTLRVPIYAKGSAASDTITVTLTLGNHPELGGTTATSTITLTIGTNADADVWNYAVVPLAQPIAGGPLTVSVAPGTYSGTYPQDKAIYVGAVGLTQTAYDPGAIPRYSFATELHQATNAKLALVSQGAPASYDGSLVDLYGLDFRSWPHLQLIPGVTARVTEPMAGVAGSPIRLTTVTVDYDRPGDTRVELGTRHQRFTEQLANARVAVPVIRINADGSAEVTSSVSQQAITLPATGTTPTPAIPLPVIIE